MEHKPIVLTPTDRAILESYKLLLEGMSDYLGEAYEIVLHSLESLDHSVIKIINGYHTGRTEGAPITDLALSMLSKIQEQQEFGYITYMSRNKKGEPLKSSTIAIQGEQGRIIGLVCMNLYLNSPFCQVINSLFRAPAQSPEQSPMGESFVDNVDELILTTVSEIRSQVQSDAGVPGYNKNKEIIARLYPRGIFNLKDAVQKTAEILGISKNTVYLHLRNLNDGK